MPFILASEALTLLQAAIWLLLSLPFLVFPQAVFFFLNAGLAFALLWARSALLLLLSLVPRAAIQALGPRFAPIFAWGSALALENAKGSATSLAQYARLDEEAKEVQRAACEAAEALHGAGAPAASGAAPSQTSSLTAQIKAALYHGSGSALLLLLHSAASHSVNVSDLQEHKQLIAAMCEGLTALAYRHDELSIPLHNVQEYMSDLRLFTGRTALCLGGGGSMAMAHLGVAKALLASGLLPRVISATSGAAIPAAICCLAKDRELGELLDAPEVLLGPKPLCELLGLPPPRAGDAPPHPPQTSDMPFTLGARIQRALKLGLFSSSLTGAHFQSTLRAQLGNETFLSAYKRTGRILILSVYAHFLDVGQGMPGGGGKPLILSYISSPYVLLYSAVQACCAEPDVLAPSTLMALNESGEAVLYFPPGVASIDGSLYRDAPLEELGLCFHARRFIYSQTDPRLLPLPPTVTPRTPRGMSVFSPLLSFLHYVDRLIPRLLEAATAKAQYLARTGFLTRAFAGNWVRPRLTPSGSGGMLTEGPTRAVFLTPAGPQVSVLGMLRAPSTLPALTLCGEQATWPHLAFIKELSSLERCLSLCTHHVHGVAERQGTNLLRDGTLRNGAELLAAVQGGAGGRSSSSSRGSSSVPAAALPAHTPARPPPPPSSPPCSSSSASSAQPEAAEPLAAAAQAEPAPATIKLPRASSWGGLLDAAPHPPGLAFHLAFGSAPVPILLPHSQGKSRAISPAPPRRRQQQAQEALAALHGGGGGTGSAGAGGTASPDPSTGSEQAQAQPQSQLRERRGKPPSSSSGSSSSGGGGGSSSGGGGSSGGGWMGRGGIPSPFLLKLPLTWDGSLERPASLNLPPLGPQVALPSPAVSSSSAEGSSSSVLVFPSGTVGLLAPYSLAGTSDRSTERSEDSLPEVRIAAEALGPQSASCHVMFRP